jgi:hypothetical protein
MQSEREVHGHYSNPPFGITDIVFPDGWHGTEIPSLIVNMDVGNQSQSLRSLLEKSLIQ